MLESSITLGKIAGIRIGVHYTWFIIFGLLTFSLMFLFQEMFPEWTQTGVVTTAVITSLLFFLSIVLHELGHSLVALSRGIPVRSITLFIFGGVAQTERDADSARSEFWIAIAGPIVSFVLAGLFFVLSWIFAGVSEPAAVAFSWLAFINFVVAVFNLVPGFPLDGGRVFRAAVWGLSGDAVRGMRWAVMGGRVVAYGLLGLGVYLVVATGFVLNGLWLAAIGWFLLSAAEASAREFTMSRLLEGVTARDVLQPDVPRIDSHMSIADWVERHALATGRRAGFVTSGDEVIGLVTLSDARKVDRDRWGITSVREVMTPREQLQVVSPQTEVGEVLRIVDSRSLNQVPVVENGRLVGWIDRDRLIKTVQMHVELRR
jgi:Zn-dependent protease/predicted transcriptional regulator